MACKPCMLAAIARAKAAEKRKKTMAKRRKTTRRKTTRRRRSVGSMTGKLQNRKIQFTLWDVLWILAGVAANYTVVNGLLNKVLDKLTKADGTPLLGAHQAKIIGALKTGTPGYLAFALRQLPMPARLALVGVSVGSGIETIAQFFPEGRLPSIVGTYNGGDLFLNVGSTPMIEIPMNSSASANGMGDAIDTNSVAVFGAGDLYQSMPNL